MRDATTLAVDVLKQVARLLDKLTEEQLTDIVEGRAEITFSSPQVTVQARTRKAVSGSSRAPALPATEVADRLSELGDRAEAIKYLEESRLTIAGLTDVANKLGKRLRGKNKDDKIRNLAEDVIGFRTRHEAILGGPYRQ